MKISQQIQRTVWPRQGVAGWLGYAGLLPLSVAFGVGGSVRNLAYRIGLLRVRTTTLPVISVGNLAVGGTGKTPFTLWLGQQLQARGVNAGILLRGYGGKGSGVMVISRGSGPEVGVEEAGDEAVMLAKSFSGPVITAPKRVAGAEAAAELGCDAVVLDDGFQHRAIARAMDLVLVDDRRRSLLPAGPLRERLRALRRADVVVLVESGMDHGSAEIPRAVANKPVYRMIVEPSSLTENVSGRWKERAIGHLAGRSVVVVSGIAQPAGFYRLLRQWDVTMDEVFEFPDHHRYSTADWQNIARRCQKSDFVVTTEKDLVKLEAFPFATGKLVALRIQARVEGGDELIAAVLETIERVRTDRETADAAAH